MSGSPAFQRLTVETLEEHRQVHFYLDQLVRTLGDLEARAQADGAAAEPDPMARLSAELGSLIERLTEHFASEEHGGLYHGVLDLVPSLGTDVRRLGDEHARILDRLEMARLHAQRSDVSELSVLRGDLEATIETMREHERAEEEILRRALDSDRRD